VRPSLAALLVALPAVALAADPPRPQGAEASREPTRAYHLTPGADGVECNLRIGPNDRVAQDGDLVIPAGATVEVAAALRGSVVVRRGARVQKAVAVGGSVRVEGGDVEVQPEGRVGGDAVSLGGRVLVGKGAQVAGDVTSLSLQLGGFNLAQAILDGLVKQGPCKVALDSPAR
jgi:hypothetical protein